MRTADLTSFARIDDVNLPAEVAMREALGRDVGKEQC